MKRAIIFGATGGIGQAISRELAANGWSLYLHCNNNWDKALDLSQELISKYPNQDFLPIKFNFLVERQKLVSFVNSLLSVNALVFAHGITDYGFLGEQKLEDIEKLIHINLTVPIELTKLFEKVLIKQDFSRIVYLGSVYGGQGSALEAVYSATKAGLSRFSQAYAREIASANLTVNVVAPGAIDTPMNNMFSADVMEQVREEIPTSRLGKGEDIAFWVKTLLDKRSSYCTGQTIYVSGGWLL